MLNEQEVRKKCLGFIRDAANSNKKKLQIEQSELNQDFFRGGKSQWTEEEYNLYKSKGVEPVTINRCRPVMKSTLGMYLQNRQSIRVLPRKGGVKSVAETWTEIIKHSEDEANAEYLYPELFFRGCIDTESYIEIEIDQAKNINGQPVFNIIPLADGDTDPCAEEYNLDKSGKFFIKKEWKDKDWVKAQYSLTDEDVDESFGTGDEEDDVTNFLFSDEGIDENTSEDDYDEKELKKKYRYRLRTIYFKEIVPGLLVVDRQAKQMKVVSGAKKIVRVKKFVKTSDRFVVQDTPVSILHKTVMLGGKVLEDKTNIFGEGITGLPVFRFAPFWDNGHANGILDDITSLNKEENIHRTQGIKLLNQTANSGWKVSGGKASDKKALQDFGSVEGLVIDLSKFEGLAEKIQPNTPAVGQMLQAQQFEQDIKRVSGVDDASMGYETGRAESGRALDKKLTQNRVTAEPVFNNLYRTLALFGNYLLDVLRKNDIYTDDEIRAVVSESSLLNVRILEKAKNDIVGQIGAELPEPMAPPALDPGIMSIVRPEDQPQVFETIKNGLEDAQMYAKEYPRLLGNWNEVIKQHAISMMLKEMRSDEVGEYGIKVTVSPSAPTERLARRMELEVVMDKYPGIIPPDLLIDAMDLPNGEEIKARLQQQQTQQAQMAGAA